MIKSGLSLLYKVITEKRESLYNKKVLTTESLTKPVVVVGNITVGGTGKTPFVDYLVKDLARRGLYSGIISRGYKGNFSGVVKVDPEIPNASSTFGDEPTLLALKNNKVPVYLAKKRVAAGVALLKNEEKIDLVISDDGFQHFALDRDLNIVLIDCTEPLKNYRLLPAGRLRESLQGLKRADYIVFTKSNWVDVNQRQRVQDFILSKVDKSLVNHAIANYEVECKEELKGPVLLLSSIANPDNFYKCAINDIEVEVLEHIVYPDHYVYTEKDIDLILAKIKKSKVLKVLTTEKDWVKLKEFSQLDNFLSVAKVQVKLESATKNLEEVINGLFNKENN